jgi:hypothetical protein
VGLGSGRERLPRQPLLEGVRLHVAFAFVAPIRIDVLFLVINIIRVLDRLIVGALPGDVWFAAGRSLSPIASGLVSDR